MKYQYIFIFQLLMTKPTLFFHLRLANRTNIETIRRLQFASLIVYFVFRLLLSERYLVIFRHLLSERYFGTKNMLSANGTIGVHDAPILALYTICVSTSDAMSLI